MSKPSKQTKKMKLIIVSGPSGSGEDSVIEGLKKYFKFDKRNRRPLLDEVNCLLSFLYTLLMHDIRSALESVGLDSCVGFLHRDRPGRPGLALDIMEEFRKINKKYLLGFGLVIPHVIRITGIISTTKPRMI